MTWPTWTAARTMDSNTKKFATTNYTPSPFNIKEAWILIWVRWLFGTLVHHFLSLLAFWIKSLFLAPNLSLDYWPVLWWPSNRRMYHPLPNCGLTPSYKHGVWGLHFVIEAQGPFWGFPSTSFPSSPGVCWYLSLPFLGCGFTKRKSLELVLVEFKYYPHL